MTRSEKYRLRKFLARANYKGLIPLMLFISMIVALTFTVAKFQLASAFPNKPPCDGCHSLDPAHTWISVTVDSETESDITYYVSGSDYYDQEEGWAVFDPRGTNIANAFNAGTFTLPKDGQTYRVYWVDDNDNPPDGPNPGKGGSAYEDITTPVVGVRDIAVTNVVPNVTEAHIGESVGIDVAVANEGTESETFDVYSYADTDTVVIGDEITIDIITGVSLGAGGSTTLSVTWNTTGVLYGNYTLSAYATPVPTEVDTVDNTRTDGAVLVTFLSDIRGPLEPDHPPDGQVDMWDFNFFALAYGKTSADPDWDDYRIADIRGPLEPDHPPDGVVDILDLGYCGLEYRSSIWS